MLFIGTRFSNLYTSVDTPARGRVGEEEEEERRRKMGVENVPELVCIPGSRDPWP